jgi:hypothetical protein
MATALDDMPAVLTSRQLDAVDCVTKRSAAVLCQCRVVAMT